MMFGFVIVPVAVHSHFPTHDGAFSNRGQPELYIDYKRIPTAKRVSNTIYGYCHSTYAYTPSGTPDALSKAAGQWRNVAELMPAPPESSS